MRRWLFIIGMGLALAGHALAGDVVLTVSNWLPSTHPVARTQSDWCTEVVRATDSRVSCRFLASPVSAPAQTFEAVREGRADLSYSVHGFTPERFVLTGLVELPFGADSAEAASVAYQRIHQRHLARHREHQGLQVMAVFTHGPGMLFTSTRPVNRLSDLDRMRLRVGGGLVTELGVALGAVPVLKTIDQIHSALDRAEIDGALISADVVPPNKLEGWLRFRSTVPGGWYNTSFALVMNEATWQRISAADRSAIESLSGEVAARAFGRSFDNADRRALAQMQARGVQVTPAPEPLLADIRQRSAILEQRWLRLAAERGLRNPAAVLREYRTLGAGSGP